MAADPDPERLLKAMSEAQRYQFLRDTLKRQQELYNTIDRMSGRIIELEKQLATQSG